VLALTPVVQETIDEKLTRLRVALHSLSFDPKVAPT